MIWSDLAAPPTSRWHRAAEIVAVGAFIALLTGFVEVAIMLAQRYVGGAIIFAPRDLVWMTPLSYLILFAVPIAVLAAMAMMSPRLMPLHVAGFCFVVVGVASQFLPFTQVHRLAALLLALGVAAQSARWMRGHRARVLPLARRGALGLVVLAAVLALGTRGWHGLAERRAVGTLPPARAGAPNVLLIIWDTARASSFSLYGHDRRTTPLLEQWATEGVVFEQAMSTSPWTLPSHASMFTGRFPHELSADWFVPLDDSTPTLAEAFGARGYATAGFVANHHYTSYDSGLDRGFQHYEDYLTTLEQARRTSWLGQTRFVRSLLRARSAGDVARALRRNDFSVSRKRDSDDKSAAEVNAGFLAWLDGARARDPQRPFFAFLNYMEAHLGPPIPEPYASRFPSDTPMVRRYDGALAYLDHEMSALLAALRERGLAENTIVIFTSDHGEMLGEHELYGHAHNLYMPVLHVPLVIAYPQRVPRGARVPTPVTLGDVAATIVDLAELDGARFPGRSLARFWTDSVAPADAPANAPEPLLSEVRAIDVSVEPDLPTAKGSMRSLRAGDWRYILNGDGREELFFLGTDPGERRNLAGDSTAQLARLRDIVGGMPATFTAAKR